MIILGLLLLVGAIGLSWVALASNQDVVSGSAGIIDIFGYQLDPTIAEVFIAGAAAAGVALFGMVTLFGGIGRSRRRSAAVRRQLRQASTPAPAPAPAPRTAPAARDDVKTPVATKEPEREEVGASR